MRTQNILIAHPTESQITILKAFMQALKIKFEITKENPYDPDFVAKILQGDEDFKNGNFKVIKTEDLWK